jgi:hypothetical protein
MALEIPTPGCYTACELWLSPWGIMAWGTTPGSSRFQPGEMSQGDEACANARGETTLQRMRAPNLLPPQCTPLCGVATCAIMDLYALAGRETNAPCASATDAHPLAPPLRSMR